MGFVSHLLSMMLFIQSTLRTRSVAAEIAQLGERQTEDLKVPGSIPGFGTPITLLYAAMICVCPTSYGFLFFRWFFRSAQ